MPRTDFNLGNEIVIDLVNSDGTLVFLGGLTEFESKPIIKRIESEPLSEKGRPLRRNAHKGWEGTFKFDRQSADMDMLQYTLESNYFNGGKEIYFQITQTIRDPKTSKINQFQYEECTLAMKDGGTVKADDPYSQTMEFCASRRVPTI